MDIDLGAVVLAVAAIGAATAFAILAGTLSARIFFDAAEGPDER